MLSPSPVFLAYGCGTRGLDPLGGYYPPDLVGSPLYQSSKCKYDRIFSEFGYNLFSFLYVIARGGKGKPFLFLWISGLNQTFIKIHHCKGGKARFLTFFGGGIEFCAF